jgi:predicted nucleic acid-binding protein
MRVVIDTNCLIAAVMPQHEHHQSTVADLARRRAAGHAFIMAAGALLEAYAVLTRLPPPHRLAPADAIAVLDRNWASAESVALTGAETWKVLRQQAAAGQAGGRIYDAAIAACARKGRADEILTWNVRHFTGAQGPSAVTPSSRQS